MPESRGGHSCAALPSTGVRLDLDQPLTPFQAFVVAGGGEEFFDSVSYSWSWKHFSSVVTLLPGAKAWTTLSSLPTTLYAARASIIGGRMRIVGGTQDGGLSISSQVMRHFAFQITNDLCLAGA